MNMMMQQDCEHTMNKVRRICADRREANRAGLPLTGMRLSPTLWRRGLKQGPQISVMAVLLIVAFAATISMCLPALWPAPVTPHPTPTAIPAQAGFPCTDQLPVKECTALKDLAGREVRSPCDHPEDFGCTQGHVTRVSLKWAHVHGFTITRIPPSIKDLPEL